MTTTLTRYFRWSIPDFLAEPWHAQFEQLVQSMDRTAYGVLIAGAHPWLNSTAYAPGDFAIDTADGTLWVAHTTHTSPASPTTFAAFRLANPTFWQDLAPESSAAASAAAAAASAAAALASQVAATASAVAAAGSEVTVISRAAAFGTKSQWAMRKAIAAANAASADAGRAAAWAMMAGLSQRKAKASATAAAASAAAIDDAAIVLKAQAFS